ncbi:MULTISPECIES: hypothetical protein [Pseudoalteromonas]|jgi:hypothetical protein|uniref:hypothetical protein n=1 Tax=Alteromonadales TaxID=135622 RepID=UPI000587D5FD|nr:MULTISPECIES: hypothetical protein [Pseudoalteromonas]TMS63045.1 hypothetical protein CWB83_20360 [Pseudoalteromonas sp. S1691]TMS68235.1 hypothetical protein CWB86_12990 [Pseudoalteromonas sp. S1731]TMS70113.1 hypothetical protein CWB88_18175 [Pseudoalteromonas sp. S1941]TMS75669.1 hypothetical protein CWB82_20355 [Pseudoalteromonas sp. S1690]TMS82225.1 hypothetical protein CWB70_20460 [Pseudoalteromonas sp. S981]
MTSPRVQANGIGTAMMSNAKKMAKDSNMKVIDIAASHLQLLSSKNLGQRQLKKSLMVEA